MWSEVVGDRSTSRMEGITIVQGVREERLRKALLVSFLQHHALGAQLHLEAHSQFLQLLCTP